MTLIPPAIGRYTPDPHPAARVCVAPSVTQRC